MASNANIREIARRAGCSPSTVSRVLSNQSANGSVKISTATCEKIMAICAELDYTPSIHAARLFSRRSKVIGLLAAGELQWDDENLARALSGTCSCLSEYGYRCLPLQYREDFIKNKEYLSIFRRCEVDALIIYGEIEDQPYLHELTAEKMPFMLLGNRIKDYPAVSADQKTGTEILVKHCIERGASKLVYLDLCRGDSSEQRRNGFLNIAGKEAPIISGGISVAAGYQVAAEAMKYSPDAIIAGNDALAVGVEKYLLEQNKLDLVPSSLLLTGGDNIEMSKYCTLPLSTFDQRSTDCAKLCVEIIVSHLEKQTPLRSEVLPVEVIFRDSTEPQI
ncbi:MAG: LacI family transcriptional regulator [Lentisphaerae bacterium]|nr:LacI family transcriptional regulator [Lentisphaerota bacterium]